MLFIRFASVALLACGLAACKPRKFNAAESKDAWNPANDPSLFGADMKRTYSALPKSGRIQTPWSDTYWPSFQGGIASRWLLQSRDSWSYKLYSAAELKGMSEEQIKRLSPAEKLDIYAKRYDYPSVRAERARTSANAERWEGLCHAWTPASLAFAEPGTVTLKNADGISIPFGSSDIKALLIYALHNNMESVRTIFAGTRCESDRVPSGWGSQTPCKDINAGAFHVILTNMLGLKKKGFVLDVTRQSQVWNQPVFAYSIVEEDRENARYPEAAPGAVASVNVTVAVSYALEISPTWEPVIKSGGNRTETEYYRYRLELDANDQILGGEFTTNTQPDFAWVHASNVNLEGLKGPGGVPMSLVKEIWSKSLGQ